MDSKTVPIQKYETQGEALKESGISTIMKYGILALICVLAFSIRLFAVVRYESVIHEFDPYFNFRATKFLAHEGFVEFLNWFDDRGWYPLGRTIGGTIYPGLMLTAATIYWSANALNITLNIRNVCVLLAPIFSANAALASYLLTTEVTKKSSAGLLAAAFTAIVPSYISRSMGGSYDNEGVAIFALIFCFYLWVKAVNTGSLIWACLCAFSYYYMVAAWGGYVFIINVIPIYVLVMLLAGRYSDRLYIAYSIFYTMGTLMAMTVPFVGFNVIFQAECASSHGVFLALQIYIIVKQIYASEYFKVLKQVISLILVTIVIAVAVLLSYLQYTGELKWSGRSLTLLDPTYATKYIPIIASVSEHQPTTWTSFFFDLHILIPLSPLGLLALYRSPSDGAIFLIIYGTIAWYFAGVMVRLMLTLAPIACILSAIGLSSILQELAKHTRRSYMFSYFRDNEVPASSNSTKSEGASVSNTSGPTITSYSTMSISLSLMATAGISVLLLFFTFHSTFVSSVAYSSPSIVIDSGRTVGGQPILYDDYREAYFWLRQNTRPDAKILSWWDYGYQISAMANRTVLVDNNTWNNTHIATVGRALASSEEDAYPIFESLDVDYVLVIFGGAIGYSSDDINKLMWPIRIGSGVFPNDMPSEQDFYNSIGRYDIGVDGAPALHNSVAYKLCYYRYSELQTAHGKGGGYDNARHTVVGVKNIKLTTLQEEFTSENWVVRIYSVKPRPNLPSLEKFKRKALKTKKEMPQGVNTGTSDQPQKNALNNAAKFVGCFTSESFFDKDRLYAGGPTGANFEMSLYFAKMHNKNYFANARAGDNGHSFAFDKLVLKNKDHKNGDVTKSGEGCENACVDYANKVCGCADSSCTGAVPKGETNNRRWAVYAVAS